MRGQGGDLVADPATANGERPCTFDRSPPEGSSYQLGLAVQTLASRKLTSGPSTGADSAVQRTK